MDSDLVGLRSEIVTADKIKINLAQKINVFDLYCLLKVNLKNKKRELTEENAKSSKLKPNYNKIFPVYKLKVTELKQMLDKALGEKVGNLGLQASWAVGLSER